MHPEVIGAVMTGGVSVLIFVGAIGVRALIMSKSQNNGGACVKWKELNEHCNHHTDRIFNAINETRTELSEKIDRLAEQKR